MVAMRVADQSMIEVVGGVTIRAERIHDLRRTIQQYPRTPVNQNARGTTIVGTKGITSSKQYKPHWSRPFTILVFRSTIWQRTDKSFSATTNLNSAMQTLTISQILGANRAMQVSISSPTAFIRKKPES